GRTQFAVLIYDDGESAPIYEYHDDGYVNVLLGNGGGAFGPATAYHLGNSSPNHLAVGDFDGNGKLDVVTDAEGLTTLLGNGDGQMDLVVLSGYYDEDQDYLVVWTSSAGVLLGRGDGTFAPQIVSDLGTGPDTLLSAAVLADFDGDGYPELAASPALPASYY